MITNRSDGSGYGQISYDLSDFGMTADFADVSNNIIEPTFIEASAATGSNLGGI